VGGPDADRPRSRVCQGKCDGLCYVSSDAESRVSRVWDFRHSTTEWRNNTAAAVKTTTTVAIDHQTG